MTLPSRPNLDDSLARIRSLLDKQDLLRDLVHKTEMRRHEVVEDLVARQYRNELRRQINHLHPADIAHLLETLRTDKRRFLWDLVDSHYAGAVLLELSDPVRSSLIETMPAEELVHAA